MYNNTICAVVEVCYQSNANFCPDYIKTKAQFLSLLL